MGLFKLKGFPGNGNFRHGIHPPDNKELSDESKVEVKVGNCKADYSWLGNYLLLNSVENDF